MSWPIENHKRLFGHEYEITCMTCDPSKTADLINALERENAELRAALRKGMTFVKAVVVQHTVDDGEEPYERYSCEWCGGYGPEPTHEADCLADAFGRAAAALNPEKTGAQA